MADPAAHARVTLQPFTAHADAASCRDSGKPLFPTATGSGRTPLLHPARERSRLARPSPLSSPRLKGYNEALSYSLLEAVVPESRESSAEEIVVLKDPALSAFLAWLIPGLGHWYQGQHQGGAVLPLHHGHVCPRCVLWGAIARSVGGGPVYFLWRDNDYRLAYLCQIGIGVPAWPALVQANRMANHEKVFGQGFMAPPRSSTSSSMDGREDPNADQPTLSELHLKLHRFFELGTAFTMIGGLLNILAIYDAWGGPVTFRPKKEEEASSDTADKTPAKS